MDASAPTFPLHQQDQSAPNPSIRRFTRRPHRGASGEGISGDVPHTKTDDTFHGVRFLSAEPPYGSSRRFASPSPIRSQGFSPSQRFHPHSASRTSFIPHPPLGFMAFRALLRSPSRGPSSVRACSLGVPVSRPNQRTREAPTFGPESTTASNPSRRAQQAPCPFAARQHLRFDIMSSGRQ